MKQPSTNHRHAVTPCRPGTVTVEFALVLPIALFLTFGMVEFSRVNMIRNSMQNAAYEGARTAIIRGGSNAEAKETAIDVMETMRVKNTEVIVNDANGFVEVIVTVPLHENMWVAPKYFAKTNIVKKCTLTKESTNSGH